MKSITGNNAYDRTFKLFSYRNSASYDINQDIYRIWLILIKNISCTIRNNRRKSKMKNIAMVLILAHVPQFFCFFNNEAMQNSAGFRPHSPNNSNNCSFLYHYSVPYAHSILYK